MFRAVQCDQIYSTGKQGLVVVLMLVFILSLVTSVSDTDSV